MTAELLISQFQFNQMTLERLLTDVSFQESFQHLPPGGNCINSLLGHIIATRSELLMELQRSPQWNEAECAVYRLKDGGFRLAGAKSMEDLKAALDDSYQQLRKAVEECGLALEEMSPLPTATGRKLTWGQRVGSYICHEAYHAGQIGLMRRMLGKPGLF